MLKTKENKGITLIALVVTIVVLLILAGISLNLVLGQNGVVTKAKEAQEQTLRETAREDVELAVANAGIDEQLQEMTQEDVRKAIEDELKKLKSDSTVEISGTGFVAKHKGYDFAISGKGKVEEGTEVAFDAEEWDKTATSADLFEWDETGTIITGYKDELAGTEKIRIPSKCVEIESGTAWMGMGWKRSIISHGIVKIELPETITKIGDYAFCEFFDLQEINIPKKVTEIGKYAFNRCEDLKSINIPSSVTSIGESAFSGCSSLETIDIPASVNNIGAKFIAGDSSITTVNIQGSPNMNITENEFKNCKNLKSITLPNTITSIGAYAFCGLENLESVNIPTSVTSIGEYAFSCCKSLESITIPTSVTSIGNGAFAECLKLSSLNITTKVIDIGNAAFSRTINLQNGTIIGNSITIGGGLFCDSWGTSTNNKSITVTPESISSVFNAEEWDKNATSADLFEWDETGTVITGIAGSLANSPKIRIPSKCKEINVTNFYINNREQLGSGIQIIELPQSVCKVDLSTYWFTGYLDSLEEIRISGTTTLQLGLYNKAVTITSIN